MIWNEELSASLDQSGGVVVFHRIDLSRAQQLAQTIADKVASMVDQNEKALDIKMGGTGGWGDRGDGTKGKERGEQTQERRGRGDRTRGGRGLSCFLSLCFPVLTFLFKVEGGEDVVRALRKVWEIKWRVLRGRDSSITCICTDYFSLAFYLFLFDGG